MQVYSSIKELLVGMPIAQPTAGRSRIEMQLVCYMLGRGSVRKDVKEVHLISGVSEYG